MFDDLIDNLLTFDKGDDAHLGPRAAEKSEEEMALGSDFIVILKIAMHFVVWTSSQGKV